MRLLYAALLLICLTHCTSNDTNTAALDVPLYSSPYPTTIPGGNTSDWQTLNDRAADTSDPNNPTQNGKR